MPCAKRNDWSYWPQALSRGRCEVCGETADCNDAPLWAATRSVPPAEDRETQPLLLPNSQRV